MLIRCRSCKAYLFDKCKKACEGRCRRGLDCTNTHCPARHPWRSSEDSGWLGLWLVMEIYQTNLHNLGILSVIWLSAVTHKLVLGA